VITALVVFAQQGTAAVSAWAPYAVALLSLLGVGYAAHQTRQVSRRQQEIERQKVDGEAYERARTFDERRFERMEDDLKTAQEENRQLRQRSHDQEVTIIRLKLQLLKLGIDVDTDEE